LPGSSNTSNPRSSLPHLIFNHGARDLHCKFDTVEVIVMVQRVRVKVRVRVRFQNLDPDNRFEPCLKSSPSQSIVLNFNPTRNTKEPFLVHFVIEL
jgi:hypothetical protein